MKRHNDDHNEAWFLKLDDIVMGKGKPSQDDDDLLHVAAKLSDAFSPFTQPSLPGLRSTYPVRTKPLQHYPIVSVRRKKLPLLAVTALVFVLFGGVPACFFSMQASAATQSMGRQIWQAATSFEQIDASSVAFQAVKRSGVRPLLPGNVPADTQSVEFGIITDNTNPQSFVAFVADYRIAEQDVSVYEQVASLVDVPSGAAQNIAIGTSKGYLFQDNAGNRILQWYQNGMTCQIASTLPVNELLTLIRQFHPITRWELIM